MFSGSKALHRSDEWREQYQLVQKEQPGLEKIEIFSPNKTEL